MKQTALCSVMPWTVWSRAGRYLPIGVLLNILIATVQLICASVAAYFSCRVGKDGTVVVVMYVNMK
jgi:hypothetical protein